MGRPSALRGHSTAADLNRLARRRHDDNHTRPGSALGGLTPAARRALEQLEGSTPAALEIKDTQSYQPTGLPL